MRHDDSRAKSPPRDAAERAIPARPLDVDAEALVVFRRLRQKARTAAGRELSTLVWSLVARLARRSRDQSGRGDRSHTRSWQER